MQVIIQQHFITHYRFCIYNLLCKQGSDRNFYTVLAGETGDKTIKTVSRSLRDLPPEDGGLRWVVVTNHWFGRHVLVQTGLVKVAFDDKTDCIVYLGSMYHLSTWLSAAIARVRGKRVLMWTHGFLKRELGLKGAVRRLFYKLANGFLLYGNTARIIMESEGFDPDSLYVVYNSLDYLSQKKIRESISQSMLKATRRKLFIRDDLPLIIFSGRLIKDKDLPVLLRAQNMLKERGFETNVLIVGNGSEQEALNDLVQELRLDDVVVFYGECYNEEELALLFMSADVCVSPGQVGLTCIHSMAYGTPVITHDCPEFQGPEFEAIVAGVSGDFFEKGSASSLADVVSRWFSKCVSRSDIAQSCHRIVECRYNPIVQVNIIEQAVNAIPATVVNSQYR